MAQGITVLPGAYRLRVLAIAGIFSSAVRSESPRSNGFVPKSRESRLGGFSADGDCVDYPAGLFRVEYESEDATEAPSDEVGRGLKREALA